MRPHRIAGVLAAAAACALVSGCSGTASTASPATPSTASATSPTSASATASPTASPTTSATTSATATASASATPTPKPSPTQKPTHDPALRGTWHADAASVVAAGAVTSRAFTSCTGPVVLTFTAQGGLADQGEVTCTGRTGTGHGQFSSTGRYTADGSVLVVTQAATRCTLSVAGVAVGCAFAYSDGTAHYRVSGTHLTLTVRTPTGTRTQTYVR